MKGDKTEIDNKDDLLILVNHLHLSLNEKAVESRAGKL